ncbi:MAG: hypothetical protein JWO67_4916 [Streptosporangiaceae bacterium]|nr:hypothetical protein [Streptosporangiaceae bacterium]
MLSFSRPGYVYEGLRPSAGLAPASGTVVWETIPKPDAPGQRLDPKVGDPPQAIGDAIPPEAIACLADYRARRCRR